MANPTGEERHDRMAHTCQHLRRAVGWVCLIVVLIASQTWSQENMRSIENSPTSVAKGQALFSTCGACHGRQGEGRQGMGPRLNSDPFLAAASDDFLVRTIRQGRVADTPNDIKIYLYLYDTEANVASQGAAHRDSATS